MLIQEVNHQGIYLRNFFTLFFCCSFIFYLNYQLNEQTEYLRQTNRIVTSLIRNQTFNLDSEATQKALQKVSKISYTSSSQSECLMKIYYDMLKNQRFNNEKLNENKFNEVNVVLPTKENDLENMENCGDFISLMNYLNKNKTDFIYTNYVNEKYGAFKDQSQSQISQTKSKSKPKQFCVFVNQFNNSLTKLRQNLKSLTDQSYSNYELVVVDNGSGDGSYEIAKIFTQDLMQEQKKDTSQKTQKKYKVLKQQHHLNEWQIYVKYSKQCQNTNYIIFVDGRDEFISNHVLNIINNQVTKRKENPHLITSHILQKKYMSKLHSAKLVQANIQLPKFVFKAISLQLFNSVKDKISLQTHGLSSSYEINEKISEIMFRQSQQKNSLLEINEMLYVYDAIENDRNEYLIRSQAKRRSKKEKK